MPEKLQELHEHAEYGAREAALARVTITMALLAVLVAAVSLMGHRPHAGELLAQTKATDQWAYYQAKDIRRRSYEVLLDELGVFSLQSPAQAETIRMKYQKEVEPYRAEQQAIQAEARKMEELKLLQRRGDRFDLGEVLLEAALVICSITLLTRKRIFLFFGCGLGLVGVAIGLSGLLIH